MATLTAEEWTPPVHVDAQPVTLEAEVYGAAAATPKPPRIHVDSRTAIVRRSVRQ